MFHGSIVALVTPFKDHQVDEAALAKLVRYHLDNGTHGFVVVGTTGESPTLKPVEHQRVVEIVAQEVSGQVPVIAGAGSNNPMEAIELTHLVHQAGADAALHAFGYYNRPSQEGIYQHFKVLVEATELPILVYNIPPRAIVDIEPETMARISELPGVVGVKDATRDLARPLQEAALIQRDFCFLSGEDPTAVAYNVHGGVGCISTTANVAPALCARMQDACQAGQFDIALEIQRSLMPLHEALTIEPSPAGVKYACSMLGLSEPDCRLPVVALTPETKATIDRVMHKLGLN